MALLLVQPATILRWHRRGFRLFWRRTSKRTDAQPRTSAETIALIEPCCDAVRFGIKMSPEVPMKQQERAWASPIWCTRGQ